MPTPRTSIDELEWGWRTHFNHAGLAADLGSGFQLKAQAITGRTAMGYEEADRRWIDNRFRSAFALLTRPFGSIGVTVRAEAFDTRNRGSMWGEKYDETGWSAMLAGKHEWGPLSGTLELLQVSSKCEEWEEYGLKPRNRQTQLQAQLRMHW